MPTVFALLTMLGLNSHQLHAQGWAPPEPQLAERDWVMLTSGEWLWGDIKLFQDQHLAFDSEELDDLDLDWEDVSIIRSARILTYTFSGERIATGTAVMEDGVMKVRTATGVEEYPRTELIKIIEGGLRELDFWSFKASVGLTARAGNTDQSDFNTVAKIRREATRTRLDLDYNGNFSKVDSAQTINNHRVSAGWNVIITRAIFVSPFIGELYKDRFQNINIRGTVGAGLGVWIVRKSDFEWNFLLGASYRDTRYISVEAGEDDKDQTGSIVPSTAFEWDITGDVELDFNYNSQIGVPDPKDSTHHLQTLLSVDVFGDVLDITANFTWDRIENPKTNAEGVTPKRDDYRLAVGLGLDL
jgi:putative salt-induced outer membrane protein YdiY